MLTRWPLWLAIIMFCLSTIAAYSSSVAFGFEEPRFVLANSVAVAIAAGYLLSCLVLYRSCTNVRLALSCSIVGLVLVGWQMTRLTGMETGLLAYGFSTLAFGVAFFSQRDSVEAS